MKIQVEFKVFNFSISKVSQKKNGNQIHEKIQIETKKDSTFFIWDEWNTQGQRLF